MLDELAVVLGGSTFLLVVFGAIAACLWHCGRLAIALAVSIVLALRKRGTGW